MIKQTGGPQDQAVDLLPADQPENGILRCSQPLGCVQCSPEKAEEIGIISAAAFIHTFYDFRTDKPGGIRGQVSYGIAFFFHMLLLTISIMDGYCEFKEINVQSGHLQCVFFTI